VDANAAILRDIVIGIVVAEYDGCREIVSIQKLEEPEN